MFESFILGAVQGIAEWLPISSEAMIILVKTNFFPSGISFSELISFAIFLHLGTLLAVVVYYWKKISILFRQLSCYQLLDTQDKKYINFIIIATAVSGILGIVLIDIVERYESYFQNESMINILVAVFLLITAILLFISERNKTERLVELSTKKGIITGIFQGFAAIPGISRSGSTVAGMALLGIDKERALELSFILSIPLVLLANIVLNLDSFKTINSENLVALFSAFIFGLITIDILLRIVRKVRFSYFVGGFAVLLIILSIMVI